MVGVSSPMYGESTRKGIRFSTGILVGSGLAALVLVVALLPLIAIIQQLPMDNRRVMFVLVATGFAILDLLGRTPHLRRQVPQRFYLQGLRSGQLGLIYGADMGLHATTIKVTSLPWVALTAPILLGTHEHLVTVTAVMALTGSSVLFILATTRQSQFVDLRLTTRGGRSWERQSQLISTVLITGLAAIELTKVASL